jgi:amidase
MWAEICSPDIMTLLAPAIAAAGDENIRTAVDYWQRAWPRELTAGDALAAVARRHGMLRLWQRFFEAWPVLVMPVSLEPAFHRLADIRSPEEARRIMRAQGPLMVISVLGLPGLSVPTGLAGFNVEGHDVTMPTGVQLVAAPEREDLCFAAGRDVEAAMPRLGVVDPRPGF